MRGLAAERVFDRHEPSALALAPRHAQIIADVGKKGDADIFEEPLADVIGLRADQLLSGAGPDPNRPGKLFTFHQLLHRKRSGDVDGLSRIVTFAVAGSAL